MIYYKTYNVAAIFFLIVFSGFVGMLFFGSEPQHAGAVQIPKQAVAKQTLSNDKGSSGTNFARVDNISDGAYRDSSGDSFFTRDPLGELFPIEISADNSGNLPVLTPEMDLGTESGTRIIQSGSASTVASAVAADSSGTGSKAPDAAGSAGSSGAGSSDSSGAGSSCSSGTSGSGGNSGSSGGGGSTAGTTPPNTGPSGTTGQPTGGGMTAVPGTTFYVSTQGNDLNNGLSAVYPLKTVAKAIQKAKPGDLVYFRGGTYRQTFSLGADSTAQFNTGATASSRITFKSYPNERAVITSMQLRDKISYWKPVPGYGSIYMTDISPNQIYGSVEYKTGRVPNCSQDGIPLKLMTDAQSNGGPELLTGPGQWVRDTRANVLKIYVWSRDGQNPGLSNTEICEFPQGGSYTIGIYGNRSRLSKKTQPDYITFENLTIEGGYYPIYVETNYIEMKNCTFRNCYGDGVKVSGADPQDPDNPDALGDVNYFNSQHGLVEGCDIYNFGEQGIDVTGGDYWILRSNRIHNNASNRGDLPGGTKGSGIILKNNCIGAVVERNKIYEIDSVFGAISLGGSSWGNIADEAVDCIVRENEMYKITGPYVAIFMAAKNCIFRDNLIRECSLSDMVIRFACGDATKEKYKNRDCSILNNTFINNDVASGLMYKEFPSGAIVNLKSDYNTIPRMNYFLDGSVISLEKFRKQGYEKNSTILEDVIE